MFRFWNEPSEFTPESRIETHKFNEELKKKEEKAKKGYFKGVLIIYFSFHFKFLWSEENGTNASKKTRKYISDNGTPFNCNEPKLVSSNIIFFLVKLFSYRVEFELTDDDENIMLNVSVFKHMDSSLVDVDVQPNYVRVTLKGKILQLCLQEHVKSELSTAQRSQTTGKLLIKMPKVFSF